MIILSDFLNFNKIISLILGFLAFLWVPFEAIDTFRYYSFAGTLVNLSVSEIVISNFILSFDFIYYLLFGICTKIGLPFQTITGISIFLLYYQSLTILDNTINKYDLVLKKTDDLLIRISIIFSVSFVTVFGIGRNVTGLVFFVYGLKFFLNDKRKWSIVFFLLAIFTHIGLIIYLGILFAGLHLGKTPLKFANIRRYVLVIISICGLFSYKIIDQLLVLFKNFFFFNKYSYYNQYLESGKAINIFNWELGKYDILMFFSLAVLLFFPLFLIRKYNSLIWINYLSFLWLIISMGFSQMFVQRTILFLILIEGILFAFYLSDQKNVCNKKIYRFLLIFSIACFFINVYGYRDALIFKMP